MTATPDPRPAPFSRSDYKTLGLAALGGALEIYDFIIFVFFALTLSQLFFPPEMPEWLRLLQSFGIFVTGYLARPLGGILMAHFADRLGRKKVFSLSILMMALPCLLIGIMPTYAQIGYLAPLLLLALRILQGAAVGGEVVAAVTDEPAGPLDLSWLGELSAQERHVLMAHFGFEGEPVGLSELAAELGVSVSTVRRMKIRALDAGRRHLDRQAAWAA